MKLSKWSSGIKALSVRILPSSFILFKPPFWDEALYISYALRLIEDPLNPYPDMGFYVPHPPGMMYRIALGITLKVNLRVRIALLNALLLLLLYRYTRNLHPLAIPGLAIYSFIIFDDAPGAILAAAAIHALIDRRYKEAAVLYFAASLLRFQSVAIAIAYALRLTIREKEPRNLVSLTGLPLILAHPGPGPGALHPSYVPFARNILHMADPAFLFLLLPVAYFDRYSRELVFVSYITNSLLCFVGHPMGYSRYYLVAAIFLASRIETMKREKYRVYAALPGIGFLASGYFYVSPMFLIPIIFKFDEVDSFAFSARLVTLVLSYNLYVYAIPHPPYDTFYLSRGEYHHFSGPLALIIANKNRCCFLILEASARK